MFVPAKQQSDIVRAQGYGCVGSAACAATSVFQFAESFYFICTGLQITSTRVILYNGVAVAFWNKQDRPLPPFAANYTLVHTAYAGAGTDRMRIVVLDPTDFSVIGKSTPTLPFAHLVPLTAISVLRWDNLDTPITGPCRLVCVFKGRGFGWTG